MIEKIDLSEVTDKQREIFLSDSMSRLSLMEKLNEIIDKVNILEEGANCNCSSHRHGESTAGWMCPVHGQQW